MSCMIRGRSRAARISSSVQGIFLAGFMLPCGVQASEGGMGRPITGMQGYSMAAVVSADPGWIFSLGSIYYEGKLESGRNVPVIGTVSDGIQPTISYNLANLSYVWNSSDSSWGKQFNIASSVGLPYQYTRVEANLSSLHTEDDSAALADILVTPLQLSYHISQLEHFSLSLPVYVPTGEYDPRRLANAGQNVWTVMPTMAYSKLDGNSGEFTSQAALEIYSRNSDTQYRSGSLFRLDLFWLAAAASNGWNWGVAAGWIQQLDDDDGPGTNLSSGFKGAALGAGPMLNWSGKFGKQAASFNMRWVPDFYARNRPKGNGLSIGLTLPLL